MPRLPAALLQVLEPLATKVSERITLRARAEIGPFSGPHRPRVHRLIGDAVELAVTVYLHAAGGDRGGYDSVGEHFRGLGGAGATAGVSIEPAVEAIGIARDVVWETIRSVVDREEVEGRVVANLGSGLASYLNYLGAQLKAGFTAEVRGTSDPPQILLAGLLQRRPMAEMVIRAAEAGRRLEESIVVVTAQRYGASPAGILLPTSALSQVDGDRTVVASVPADVGAVRDALLQIAREVTVAESWPIPLRQAWHGYRWTSSALALARAGRLPVAGRVIDCAAHQSQLLREADPALLETIAQDLLAPLMALGPNWRLVLAQTLQRWLEFNESARVLGVTLGVHANTVRYRLRELRALYGDRLDDPDSRMDLRACLRAVLPAWQAEVELRRRRRHRG